MFISKSYSKSNSYLKYNEIMIHTLQLKNFRNFSEKTLSFDQNYTSIVWNNGVWKSNILEAISILHGNEIFWLEYDDLVKKWEDTFFVQMKDFSGNTLSISFSSEQKTKKIIINWKATTLAKLRDFSEKTITFHPLWMNLMYLSPSLRRDFLDGIIHSSFPLYQKVLKNYKDILKNRNALLKSICEKKAGRDMLPYWDNKFIESANQVYSYREKLTNFFNNNISILEKNFETLGKWVCFSYITKVDKQNVEVSIREYLEKNKERDIILWTTPIGPHVDDFDIIVNEKSISHYASRWEIKSSMIGLKMIEALFVEQNTWKKPIILIDDLLSEIDENHKSNILWYFDWYQTITTSITENNKDNFIIYV